MQVLVVHSEEDNAVQGIFTDPELAVTYVGKEYKDAFYIVAREVNEPLDEETIAYYTNTWSRATDG